MRGNAHRSNSRRYAVGLIPVGRGRALDPLELTFKVMEFVIESHPGMPRRLPHGCHRPGHRRVGERSKGDADEVRVNDAVVADSLHGWSTTYHNIFPINIMQFGSVSWVAAQRLTIFWHVRLLGYA